MLSVLIPVYNHDVSLIVTELDHQLSSVSVPYEIIMIDDGSEISYRERNSALAKTDKIQYFQNQTNIGRAKIRNLLATKAKYPYLLFMDCDVSVRSQDYIRKYIDAVKQMRNHELFVINGGVAYQTEKPDDQYYLRWFYGKKREEENAEKRTKKTYHHFTPFNVILTRKIFDTLKFNETLTSYGHEDTLFGHQLKQQQIPYLHIDNPLIHEGLDTNDMFLQKTRVSIDNLVHLLKNQELDDFFIEENRLLKSYRLCCHTGIRLLLAFIFKHYDKKIRQILERRPNLILFDFYKLCYLSAQNS